jgi:hypothetical protein
MLGFCITQSASGILDKQAQFSTIRIMIEFVVAKKGEKSQISADKVDQTLPANTYIHNTPSQLLAATRLHFSKSRRVHPT